jgi:hypothetical protein
MRFRHSFSARNEAERHTIISRGPLRGGNEEMRRAVLVAGLTVAAVAVANGNGAGMSAISLDDPAIQYNTRTPHDAISYLNERIQRGQVHLQFEKPQGYLRSVLDALDVPVESQLVVFSKTSFQSERISPANPRSIFFNDSVMVGFVRGAPLLELAADDPRQGMMFFSMGQSPVGPPHANRDPNCLPCHVSGESMGVPGTLMRSVYPDADGKTISELGTFLTDDRSLFTQRWGGWYVTGFTGSMRHMGNSVVKAANTLQPLSPDESHSLTSLKGLFDTDAYVTPYSDVVALMVFEHQMHMINLFTKLGWEVRVAEGDDADEVPPRAKVAKVVRDASRELADYMLFTDEKPLPSKVEGTSGFAENFSSEGPNDSQGRSLRQFNLEQRLMKYPCSYMIYSSAFDALPDDLKDATYARMWQILSGEEHGKKYAKLTLEDRRAIVEILRGTKKRLPEYFQTVTR